jgi:hypothetical protein
MTELLLTVIFVEKRVARRSIDDGGFEINDGRVAIHDRRLAINHGWLAINDGRLAINDGRLLIHDGRGTWTCNSSVVMIIARAHLDGRRAAPEQCTYRHSP